MTATCRTLADIIRSVGVTRPELMIVNPKTKMPPLTFDMLVERAVHAEKVVKKMLRETRKHLDAAKKTSGKPHQVAERFYRFAASEVETALRATAAAQHEAVSWEGILSAVQTAEYRLLLARRECLKVAAKIERKGK